MRYTKPLRITLLIVTILAALGVAGVVGLSAVLSPASIGLGLVLVSIYLIAFYFLISRSGFAPNAGFAWVFSSFAWGSAVCFGLATFVGTAVSEVTGKLGWDIVAASFGGAYPEEIAKTLGVILVMAAFTQLNRPWHGFATGIIVGLGFDTIENLLYGQMGGLIHPDSDIEGTLMMWGLRSIAGPGLHILFTGIAGYGIGLAMTSIGISFAQRLKYGATWFAIAFVLHFAWNLQIPTEVILIGIYIIVGLIGYPLFIYLWLQCRKAARADRDQPQTPISSLSELNELVPLDHSREQPRLFGEKPFVTPIAYVGLTAEEPRD
ncbi:PrsW family intramembrane metalloprotease [Corynebacterium sp. ES2794-CONJ1]|uniref:PrsW family intramembrane metalloprotease n=1 Tax=unclassified Corynebacterium TaxID=2624378 RepID=UPI00216984B5|nr:MULTISPECIES: PrsW family intramembrane metalloprotease [unclassified Corynebacterium]MCS4490387.1 PrsW family intramembrane metalloprotease [Corynebacterium sp. ES2775-CONJ]MCS4492167.1 PrsW family intramembrane metalloprotease [Corynebacterium sp. ES2715-CONJ3]MCU9519686.1 PrsW family intramembrane metalloprotease [Corynebacterium sp. ES2794-CONJ1]